MIRRVCTALLVAIVASFALSSSVYAAPKKPLHPRTKHSSHAGNAAAAKPTAKKRAIKKRSVAKKSSSKAVGKSGTKPMKRKSSTKPR